MKGHPTEELGVFNKLKEISAVIQPGDICGDDTEKVDLISAHKPRLQSIRHKRPSTAHPYRIGIYIRYYYQTEYDYSLAYHKKQFSDSIALCPKWTLADFYIDTRAFTPYRERSPEWDRLLEDCMTGKVDLIITQKVSYVSKTLMYLSFCTRLLAGQKPPVGIYFISEDIFTLAY